MIQEVRGNNSEDEVFKGHESALALLFIEFEYLAKRGQGVAHEISEHAIVNLLVSSSLVTETHTLAPG